MVIAGPPNAGKSTLFNALVEREAAITAPIAGTTRDLLVASVAIEGVAFSIVDTAGLRDDSQDMVEQIGIARAQAAQSAADVVLWLGPEGEGVHGAWEISAQSDQPGLVKKARARHVISAVTGFGLAKLRTDLVQAARATLPLPGETAINQYQAQLLSAAWDSLNSATRSRDLLLIAEGLRGARAAFDSLIGRSATEDMLEQLFSKFCIGK